MFLDLRDQWPPVPPPTPRPASGQRRLSKRGERILGLIVVVNLVALIVAPIAGSSVVKAVSAALTALQR